MKNGHRVKIAIIIGTIVSFITGAGSLTGCTDAGSPPYSGPPQQLALAAYAGDTGALVYVAEEQGYFIENGLEVTIQDYEAGKLAADALLADEADLCVSADSVLVSNSFEHDDLRVPGTVSLADVNELVARIDRGINQPGDLKGKRIGITKKSAGEFFLGSFLIFHGLSVRDVEIVDLNPSGIVDAMVNGDIDAALTWEPNIFNIKRLLGWNVTSWPGQSGRDLYFILITKEAFIEENPEAIQRFLQALVQAEEFIKENETEVKQFVETKFSYEPAYIDYSWPRCKFTVALPQTLIVAMEDQARWRISNQLTEATQVPNYLNYVYLTALEEVKPEAVGIIR